MDNTFSRDSRLLLRYSHPPGDVKLRKLLEDFKPITKRKFIVEANEPYFDRYFIACSNCTVVNLMDAACFLRPNRQWSYLGKQTYCFEESVDGAIYVYGTHGEALAEKRFAILNDIFSEIQSNSALNSQAFDSGISGSQIPRNMQGKLRDLIDNERSAQPLPQGHSFSSMGSQEMSNFRLSAKKENVRGLDVFTVNVGISGKFGYNMSYSDQKSAIDAKRKDSQYHYSKYQFPSLDQKLQRNKTDQIIDDQKIDFNAYDKTAISIITFLHTTYNIDFLCDFKDEFRQKNSIQIRKSTLSSTLDQITRAFPGTNWEYRKTGMVLLRSPKNPLSKPFR